MLTQVLELSPLAAAAFGPPLLVWCWGHALAQFASGLSSLRAVRRATRDCEVQA